MDYLSPKEYFAYLKGFSYEQLTSLSKGKLRWWASEEGLEYDEIKHWQVILWLVNEEYIHYNRRRAGSTKQEYIDDIKKRIFVLVNRFNL